MRRLFTIIPVLCILLGNVYAQNQSGKLNYTNQWKNIDKLIEDGLPQSALIEIDKVYQTALKNKEYGQFLKSVMKRTDCQQMTEENPYEKIIYSLYKDAEAIPYPVKSVIYSLTGEAFRGYYLQNRWKSWNRTPTDELPDNDHIESWSQEQVISEVVRYYLLSLENADLLQKTSINVIKDALTGDASTRYLRPTLYDFLAHRAIDMFMQPDLMMDNFSVSFPIDRIEYFADAQGFTQADIQSKDTMSFTFRVMHLFQDLTVFRLKQNDMNALADVDLKRLKYVRDNGIYDDPDMLYEEALKHLKEACTGQKIWGKTANTLASYFNEEGKKWTTFKTPDYRYRFIDAVNQYREVQEKALLKEDKKYAADMLKELTQAQVNLEIQKEQLPNKAVLAQITYRNVDMAYLFVYPLDKDLLSVFEKGEQNKEYKKFLAAQHKISQQSITLPKQTDYQEHKVEVKLDTLKSGQYLLVLSDRPDPVKENAASISYTTVQVSDLFLLQRMSGLGSLEAYITYRETGFPIENAKVEIYRQKYQYEKREYVQIYDTVMYTNALGQITYPKAPDQGGTLRITYEGDSIEQQMMYIYRQPSENKQTSKIVLFTDRAIYRPGQTVYFKGIVYQSEKNDDLSVHTNLPVEIQLKDVNGKEVTKQNLTTNEFGSIKGNFILPQGGLNGYMTLQTTLGSISIRVEEYKRPTFNVELKATDKHYSLGDSMKIPGEAKAFAGYPVDGGKLQYTVTRTIEYRPFRYIRNSPKIFPPIRNQRPVQIASGDFFTDDNGQFTISFKAEDTDIQNRDLIYIYDLSVDVTDVNGETQSTSKRIRLSGNSMLLSTNIPENISVDKENSGDLKYDLSITNLDGVAIPTDAHIELYALKSPERILRERLWATPDTAIITREDFDKDFPKDAYLNENEPGSYAKKKMMASWDINTLSVKQIDLSILKEASSGWYLVRIEAKNKQGTASDSTYICLHQENSPITNMNQWLSVLKKSGEPGDSISFMLAGGQDTTYIRYDVLFKDKVVRQGEIITGTTPRKITFPIEEAYRGGFAVQFALIQDNRSYTALHEINVPYTNKNLDIAFQTFRGQLLPGEKEKWTLTVKNKQGGVETAEMAATLYDASLDMFTPHTWKNTFYTPYYYGRYAWNRPYSYFSDITILPLWSGTSMSGTDYEQIPLLEGGQKFMMLKSRSGIFAKASGSSPTGGVIEEEAEEFLFAVADESQPSPSPQKPSEKQVDLTNIPLRSNFSETAFFYPELRTNEKGEIMIEFTIPDALTKWNMLGFAHTKDFKTGDVDNSLITQKKVAISANLPRFFKQGDTLVFSAKVNNLTESELKGTALLRFYDAFTMQSIDAQIIKSDVSQSFNLLSGKSTDVQWRLVVPGTLQAVTYRLIAQAGTHTDGEERSVPVLSDRILLTESMPFMLRGDEKLELRFDKLADNTSGTVQNRRLTLEYTSNPAWYAVQALPYIMEQSNECSEQIFTRFYANSLAASIVNSSSRVKQIFNQWRSIPDNKSHISNLEKNQDLKQALLEETPWVMEASNDTERKKRIGLLFDFNRMSEEQKNTFERLKNIQSANGGFPWFAGQPEDQFFTQYIVVGLEHMRKLGVLPRTEEIGDMIQKAMDYCDIRINEDYEKMSSAKPGTTNRRDRQVAPAQVQYLYMCSFSQRRPYASLEAFDFYLKQAEEYWARFNLYEQAMTAIIMYRYGKPDVAQSILRSLKERAQVSNDMGIYWTRNRNGYYWYNSPIETQAMLIEAFNEVGSDNQAVEEMKLWLLRNKQTTDWKTTKATAQAIYALLSTGYDLLDDPGLPLDIRIGGKPLKKAAKEPLRPEAGTGYVNTSWNGDEISNKLANLRVINPNPNVVWGAMYWQYFELSDKVTSSETNLKITRQLFIKRTTAKGKRLIPILGMVYPEVGDVVTVRLELHADRDFEYVHLKDMRASGLEPINMLSGYRYQDGLGYYENIKDASVNFFISHLRKGTYILEYDLRATHAGDFSNGVTTFQCMYAPEYNAHTEGIRIKIKSQMK
ncbi:MAG: hypothetical protein LBQ60_20300 [Bacteroidales bacterium]|jgi:uncharacterized protein YfaS (alpha-2-macroglobulin family)|nr:hypothetical protein [Bacteroidales bacterium]